MSQTDPKKLFLGKLYDSDNKVSEEKLLYDPADLNTHCVITGMTGSGKTGLGIITLEEIALKKIPAIIIDPKGDLTNLLLHFPNMTGADIAPWIDPEEPARQGKDLETLADETAKTWVAGQEKWGLTADDVAALKDVDYTLFTPGSSIGNPVNIMASFAAPETVWKDGDENLREEISTSVTALLGLIGISDVDPIQSREHILLANIIEYYWKMGKSVTLVDMINAINEPPFEKMGALNVDKIYPAKDRFSLAMMINNFLASPSFQSWNVGPSLDISKLIKGSGDKPRFSIFYIQHLSDKERMFFVTMLYSQIESWMRQQTGTGNLRLAVYFDEMAGYVPPTAVPSSKPVILRMLKQARAFGVSLILSTQNPIDIDYKGLSNAGTWFVGRLQTEQDKARLLDGLSTTAGEIKRAEADKLISALEKRSFVYMNVHKPGLKVMTTRWTLNYLAGPVTRALIPSLLEKGLYTPMEADAEDTSLAEQMSQAPTDVAAPAAEKVEPASNEAPGSRPKIAATINEYYMLAGKKPEECGASADAQATYIPAWIAQAEVRVSQRKYNLDMSTIKAAEIDDDNIRGSSIRWDDYACEAFDLKKLNNRAEFENVSYQTPPDWMMDTKLAKTYESDFTDYIYRGGGISVYANEKLGVFVDTATSKEDFLAQCKAKVEDASAAEKSKLMDAHQDDLDKLETKMKKLQVTISEKEEALKSRNMQKFGAYGELALSLLTGRRKSISSSLTKTGQSSTAEKALEKAMLDMDDLKSQVQECVDDYDQSLKDLQKRWDDIAQDQEEVRISINKKDIFVDAFGICWMPYFTDSAGKLVRAF